MDLEADLDHVEGIEGGLELTPNPSRRRKTWILVAFWVILVILLLAHRGLQDGRIRQEEAMSATMTVDLSKDEMLVAALLEVYAHQTEDEQRMGGTVHDNGRGFSGTDGSFCSSLAVQFMARGSLSPKQLAALRKIMPKYRRQIPADLKPVAFRQTAPAAPKPPKSIEVKGSQLIIRFPYNPELVQKVRSLPERRWLPEWKAWSAPVTAFAIQKLEEWGFEIPAEARRERTANNQIRKMVREDVARKVQAAVKTPLYPFQMDGVTYAEEKGGRVLFAYDMGLGKTLQALAWLSIHPEITTAVIVVPASLKINWVREAQRHTALRAEILSGKNAQPLHPGCLYVINYDILNAWKEEVLKLFQGTDCAMVMDEVHYCKERSTQRTKACTELSKAAKWVIGLSGTPLVNRPVELFPILNMLKPQLFPSFMRFALQYCGATKGPWGWDFSGATNLMELHEILSREVMVRKLKAEVMPELPPKVRTVVPLEVDLTEYARARDNFMGWLGSKSPEKLASAERAEALVRLGALKQLAAQAKLESAMDWIDDYLEGSGKKLVVFAHHKAIISALRERYAKVCVVVDGETPMVQRQDNVDAFQSKEEVRLFIGNIKAAGVGLTLTAADATCFLEMGWTPGEHTQAEDRVHRIGQKSDSVSAYYLIAQDTLEADLCRLIQKKQKVLEQTLDGKGEEDGTDWDVFSRLLQTLGKDKEEANDQDS